MPAGEGRKTPSVYRTYTTAVFVVYAGRVLLLRHRRYGKWLPPGGHLEPHELPDEAACREVREETGLDVELVGPRGLPVQQPRQLVLPRGLQVREVGSGRENVDIVYFARPKGWRRRQLPPLVPGPEAEAVGWFDRAELERMELTEEIRLWAAKALRVLG